MAASQHRTLLVEGFPQAPLFCLLHFLPCSLLLASPEKCRLLAPCPAQCGRSLCLSSLTCFSSRTQALRDTTCKRREETRHRASTPATEELPASPCEPAAAAAVQAASTMNLEKAGKGRAGMQSWALRRRHGME